MTRSLRTGLYGNYAVLAPNGIVMFNTSKKKAEWYLKRNLADIISEDPPVVQLKFNPNGMGHAGDQYYLARKENLCVVCGIRKQLTRHHILPWCYRRYLPESIKDHSYHDIVLLCISCHNKYEGEASKLKEEIAKEYGIPVNWGGFAHDPYLVRVRSHASALFLYGDKIPRPRLDELMATLKSYYAKDTVSRDELEAAAGLDTRINIDQTIVRHGEYVVKHTSSLQEFVFRWRSHFLMSMQPKYMPTHWDVNRPIYKINHSANNMCMIPPSLGDD